MNNSYDISTGKAIGYCSVKPKTGEEHMFGDVLYSFSCSGVDMTSNPHRYILYFEKR